jgi:cystathionine beta-synthase
MKCNNILEAVGRTPLVRLNRINQGLKPQIYVKADYINPGGSVKDRIGITMIDDAEKKGLLKPTNNRKKKWTCSKRWARK